MTADTETPAAVDLARELLYRFLATALRRPGAGLAPAVLDADGRWLLGQAGELLREDAATRAARPGFGELPADELSLAALLAALPDSPDEHQAEFDRVFGLIPPRECTPYETEHHPPDEAFFRAQQMADVAGFYRAFGVRPSAALPEQPDYLPLELEFVALLLAKKRMALAELDTGAAAADTAVADRARVCDEAAREFLRDHLAWWVPSFCAGLRKRAGGGLYVAVARLLAALVTADRVRYGIPPPRVSLPAAPAPPAEEEGACAGCAG